jgi:hypothetical protein
MGTALGAIFLSHLSLYFLDLDQVFKLNVLLLVCLAVYLFTREKRWRLAAVVTLAALAFLAGPRWDRSSHYIGLFLDTRVKPFHFQGVFEKPNLAPGVVLFEDGPDSTLTVTEVTVGTGTAPGPDGASRNRTLASRSIVINGKPDGGVLSDYSTITLAAMLPYLHAPDRRDLKAAVVGLGTGLTAGVLARAEDVEHVTAVEISSTLVRRISAFDAETYGLSTNPKVEIVATDGFKYFSRLDGRLDIAVSATSPPWVVGVENLFTPEVYALAYGALADDGVFLQWFPLYDMDGVLLRSILANLRGVFPHLRLYRISDMEMGILAAKSPLPQRAMTRRFEEPGLREVGAKMRLQSIDQLSLIALFETRELDFMIRDGATKVHTLANPGLAYASDRVRFINPAVDWNNFVDARLVRLTRTNASRVDAFASALEMSPRGLECTLPEDGVQLFCERFNRLWSAHRQVSRPVGEVPLALQVQAYDLLRQEGVQSVDGEFLSGVVAHLIERFPSEPDAMRAVLENVLTVFVKDGMLDEAVRSLSLIGQRGLITADYTNRMLNQLEMGRQSRERFVSRYRGG